LVQVSVPIIKFNITGIDTVKYINKDNRDNIDNAPYLSTSSDIDAIKLPHSIGAVTDRQQLFDTAAVTTSSPNKKAENTNTEVLWKCL